MKKDKWKYNDFDYDDYDINYKNNNANIIKKRIFIDGDYYTYYYFSLFFWNFCLTINVKDHFWSIYQKKKKKKIMKRTKSNYLLIK